jgi:hypothetical protein
LIDGIATERSSFATSAPWRPLGRAEDDGAASARSTAQRQKANSYQFHLLWARDALQSGERPPPSIPSAPLFLLLRDDDKNGELARYTNLIQQNKKAVVYSGWGGVGGLAGGIIVLRAEERLEINGAVYAQGARGGVGSPGGDGQVYNQTNDTSPGGNGGNGGAASVVSTCQGGTFGARACDTFGPHSGSCPGRGGAGGNGGASAGGGILLHASTVVVAGTVNNAGGSSTSNGGKVNIVSACSAPATGTVLRDPSTKPSSAGGNAHGWRRHRTRRD